MLSKILAAVTTLLLILVVYLWFYQEPVIVITPEIVEVEKVPDEYAALVESVERYEKLLKKTYGIVPLYSYSLSVDITGASARPEETDDDPWYTANNTLTRVGILGLSRDLLNEYGVEYGDIVILGTMVDYSKYGIYHVDDTIDDRFTKRANIIMGNKEAAKLFGVQKGVLTIIKPHPIEE
jgi:3D (Asp-Asp-Asp) domain-containing protein